MAENRQRVGLLGPGPRMEDAPMTTLQAILSAVAALATLGLIRLWWTRSDQGEPQATLSPDLLPRPRLRHWWEARGSYAEAKGIAESEAKYRRHLSLGLSSHGTDSADLGDARCGTGRVRREPEDVLRFPKRRAS